MKPKFSERGQALVIIALAAIGLFAITGLAIDGSAKYSDRRHAQNAADNAALAGALALTNEKTDWKLDALDRAADNGYVDSVNEVKVYRCDEDDATCGDYYAGSPNYVQVIITSHVSTYFARVIGIQETVNTVSAVTYWSKKGPTYGADTLKSLKNNGCIGNGNLNLGGNGTISLTGGGGIFVNNTDPSCGIEQTGCPTIDIDGAVSSVGSTNINLGSSSTTCTADNDIPDPADYAYNSEPFQFPPDMPAEPDECVSPVGQWTNSGGVSYLQPGHYNEFPPKDTHAQPRYDTIVLLPGTYCVDDTIKLATDAVTISGVGVTLFITEGHKFSFEGGTINLTAPTVGDFPNYVIIVDSDFSGSPLDCKIDGNSANSFEGTIFAPYCDVILNGSTTSGDITYNTQIVAYTISITGDANVHFNYNPDDVAQSAPKVGIMR